MNRMKRENSFSRKGNFLRHFPPSYFAGYVVLLYMPILFFCCWRHTLPPPAAKLKISLQHKAKWERKKAYVKKESSCLSNFVYKKKVPPRSKPDVKRIEIGKIGRKSKLFLLRNIFKNKYALPLFWHIFQMMVLLMHFGDLFCNASCRVYLLPVLVSGLLI